MKSVMIDIETMDLTEQAAIVSIGAVPFDPVTGFISDSTFYTELAWKKQGRLIDSGTSAWWDDREEAARACLNGKEKLEKALNALVKWIDPNVIIWANDPLFDIGILNNAYRQCGIAEPWKHWNVAGSYRALKLQYEWLRGGLDRSKAGNAHNALDDARNQAVDVCKMWKAIHGKTRATKSGDARGLHVATIKKMKEVRDG